MKFKLKTVYMLLTWENRWTGLLFFQSVIFRELSKDWVQFLHYLGLTIMIRKHYLLIRIVMSLYLSTPVLLKWTLSKRHWNHLHINFLSIKMDDVYYKKPTYLFWLTQLRSYSPYLVEILYKKLDEFLSLRRKFTLLCWEAFRWQYFVLFITILGWKENFLEANF